MSLLPIPPLWPLPRFTDHHFYVEIDNTYVAMFHECKGLGAKLEAKPVKDGGNNHVTRHLPYQVSCTKVTLSYGVSIVDEVWHWFQKSLNGKPERRTIVVHQYLNNGVFPGGMPMVSWRLHDCLPTEFKGTDYSLKSAANVALDSITVQPSRLERL